jgi:hypothetical protein
VAELTRAGGFLGAVAVELSSAALIFYRGCLGHIEQRQGFRSVLAGSIASAVEGHFGSDTVPSIVGRRVGPGQLFLWPLMAVLWGFDVGAVARRSLIVRWIADCPSFAACHAAFFAGREHLGAGIRPVENLPRHEDVSLTSPYSLRPEAEP